MSDLSTVSATQPRAVRELSPWWTVVAGGLGVALGAGIVTAYMWGIFAKSIAAEFGWDRSTVALCLSWFLFTTAIGSVTFGSALARFGVRGPTIAFVLVFGMSVAAVGLLPNSPPLFYCVFAVMGVAGIAATAMPYSVAITAWFDRQRGLALGLMVAGSGFGAVLGPQLARYLTVQHGWRSGLVIVGVIVMVVPVLGLLFLVREPPRASPKVEVRVRNEPARFNARAYLGRKDFWLIALPILGVSITTIGVVASVLVPLLGDRQFSGSEVAAVLSVAGVGSWVGRIGVGYTMDKVFAPYVTAAVLILTLCGVVLVGWTETLVPIALGAALIGLALGAEADIVGFLVSRYFSFDIYSKVLGAVWIAWAWGGGIGTYLAGKSYDLTHSYNTSLGAFVIILAMCALIVLRLGPYHYPPVRHHAGMSGSGDLAGRTPLDSD